MTGVFGGGSSMGEEGEAQADAGTPTLAVLLSRSAMAASEAPAVVSESGAVLPHGALLEEVTILGDRLASLGVGPKDRVAVALPNGPTAAVASLGVACAATCAPLNPAYGAADFEFYLRDLGARVLLIGRDDPSPAKDVARGLGIAVLEIVASSAESPGRFTVEAKDAGSPPAGTRARVGHEVPCPDDVALVLHTSGTTSRPKIVPLTHRNLCASARNVAATLGLTPHDRCLNLMPLFHIHGLVAGLLASLSAGASVVCTGGFRESAFFDWLHDLGPIWYTAVPTIHQAVLAEAANNPARVAGHGLRFIRSSSSALPPTVMTALEKAFGCPVIEAYGMTEAAHQMASNPLPPLPRRPGSVGLAAGPELAVMDEAGNLLAQGARGEIVIRGPNVTPGYEANPEANAKVFTNGWFRTGDEGYLDGDGYLFLTGRLKEIINRGGEKIAPREIDEALLEHAGVAQAVAFAVPHPTLGEDVAAAVVQREGAALDEAGLREFLFARVAEFKVPSQIVLVDRIPKGPTGKIQRIGLAEQLADHLRTPHVVPRNALEAVVAAVYAEVLRLDKVGALDSFFVLGGDSLKATQVVSRLQALLPLSLPIVTVFQKPGVAELANAVGSLLRPDDLARLERSLAVGDAAGLGGSPDERVGGGSGGIQRIPRGGGRREGSD